jgi:Mitochondrial branched-chain alpha-ketoacid dehydrogenase kinase
MFVPQVACFLHRELPVRLAHRACDLEATDLFKHSEGIMSVCNWYKTSFDEIRYDISYLFMEM